MKPFARNLVCQYLENISRDALQSYIGLISKYVNGRHGIYALYRGSKLYYVGLASDLRSRLKTHLNDRHADTWDRFSIYITIEDRHLREIEALLHRIAMPDGNTQTGKLRHAENLSKTFVHDIREFHRAKERALTGTSLSVNKSKRSKNTDSKAVLAKYITRRIHIRMIYKEKTYIAHVRRDGTIKFASKSSGPTSLHKQVFTSPSGAAVAITGKPTNGWMTWVYERAPGNWATIDKLRE